MNARAASSPYIFSGLLKCGLCGNNFTLVSGTGAKRKSARYGCPFHATRGTCKNSRLVARDVLETELLAKLQRDVLSDVAIDYVLDKVGQEIEKRFAALDGEMEGMQRWKKALESELGNLSKAVADGMDSPSLRAAITEREAELSAYQPNVRQGDWFGSRAGVRFTETRKGRPSRHPCAYRREARETCGGTAGIRPAHRSDYALSRRGRPCDSL